jgi:hypothetical protein
MNTKSAIIAVAVLGILGMGCYWWLSQPLDKKPPVFLGIVLDRSDSLKEDPEGRALIGLLKRSLAVPGISKMSKIFVSATGDPESAMEPLSIAVLDIPMSQRVMEGKEVVERHRRELLAGTAEHYKKDASETRNSPIYLALARALAQLRAAGCAEGSACGLFVRSDGEETEEIWIRDSLKRGKLLKKGMPAPLDNTGIKAVWCGLAETRGLAVSNGKHRTLTPKRTSSSAEFMTALWTGLFQDPKGVVFEPFCPTVAE